MTRIYLASPNTQQQAEHCQDMPVLLSFAVFSDWIYRYQQCFSRILIDSGAYSELNTGKKIDVLAYKDWSEQWFGVSDAIAGLDDIKGDYKKGLENLKIVPWSFPTWHIRDPLEIIPDLVALAYERGKWLGMSCKEKGKEDILRKALELIPNDIHLHGWAMRQYSFLRRFDSFDSTSWWRNAMILRPKMPWLHLGECVEIIIKKYQRESRMFDLKENIQSSLFDIISEAEKLSTKMN
jgi:hypothetical protein